MKMKVLKSFLVLFLFSTLAWGQWTYSITATPWFFFCMPGDTECTLDIAPILPGSYVAVLESSHSVAIHGRDDIIYVTDNGSDLFFVDPKCQAWDRVMSRNAECAYTTVPSEGGATQVTVTRQTGGYSWDFAVIVFKSASGQVSLDSIGAATNPKGSLTQFGVPLTLSGTDIVFQLIDMGAGVDSMSPVPPYNAVFEDHDCFGVAITNQGAAPSCTSVKQLTSASCGLAFREGANTALPRELQ